MINRKMKTCVECGDPAFIWSKGRCKRCASKGYPRIKTTRNEAKIAEQKRVRDLDLKTYMSIWNTRPHVCYECNKKLSHPPNLMFFHHLIKKAGYPEFRHDEENIVLLCTDCHYQTETDPTKTPRVRELTVEIIKKKIDI